MQYLRSVPTGSPHGTEAEKNISRKIDTINEKMPRQKLDIRDDVQAKLEKWRRGRTSMSWEKSCLKILHRIRRKKERLAMLEESGGPFDNMA